MSNTADFTQGSILKKLCRFMLPVLGALILQAAYGAVDLLVVGRFGSTSGLSAVSTGSQVLNLVTFVVTQLAMGVTVLIARYIGEKREKEIGAVLGGAAVVFTILAGCLFVLLVLFARPISVLMQAPQEALALTASYVRICGCGILFIVAYNVLSAVFRGLGDSRSPLLFVLVACLVNVAGDLVLVAGLHLDAAGAALATLLGLKPVLQIQGGKLDAYAKVRGMANAEKTMLKALEKDLQTRFAGKKVHIAAAYSGDIKPALEWRKTIRKYFDDNSIELYKLPISICCHVSSGVKALGCFEYFE